MERFVIYAAVAGLLGASAQSVRADDDWMARCKSASQLAEAVMKGRQDGGSMADMMSIDYGSEQGAKSARILIVEAFKQPRYESAEYQHRAVVDFGNTVYGACTDRFAK